MLRTLPIFVINLARRPDRLAKISKRLTDAGLAFQRIDAIDALSVTDAEIEPFFSFATGFGGVAKGDRCCTLSHVRTFEQIAQTSHAHALVLEDDAVFDGAALRSLVETTAIPPHVDLVKIEAYGSIGRRILVGEPFHIGPATKIARLYSRHTGTGGYIISRKLALWLLGAITKWSQPIDHMLFNPQTSPIFDRIRPHQLLPPVVRQVDLKADSDIDVWRRPLSSFSRDYVQRELWRFGVDLAALPKQVARVATGRWRLVKV